MCVETCVPLIQVLLFFINLLLCNWYLKVNCTLSYISASNLRQKQILIKVKPSFIWIGVCLVCSLQDLPAAPTPLELRQTSVEQIFPLCVQHVMGQHLCGLLRFVGMRMMMCIFSTFKKVAIYFVRSSFPLLAFSRPTGGRLYRRVSTHCIYFGLCEKGTLKCAACVIGSLSDGVYGSIILRRCSNVSPQN